MVIVDVHTREVESVLVMDEPTLADAPHSLFVDGDDDIDLDIKRVSALLDLAPDLLTLPTIPIGDGGYLALAFVSVGALALEVTKLGEVVLLSALTAGECLALTLHLTLCHTVGALIEYALESVRAE